MYQSYGKEEKIATETAVNKWLQTQLIKILS